MTTAAPTPEQYDRLQRAFDLFNERLFGGELPPCLITLQRQKRVMGYFSHRRFVNAAGEATDELAMNPEFFGEERVLEVLQTIAHEMCHLWQSHFGKPGRGRYHNKEWADKMEAIGLMPSDTGRPGGNRTGDHMADYPMEGGRFLEVAKELLSTEYNIPWADRFSIAAPVLLDTDALVVAEGSDETAVPPPARGKTKYSLTCKGETLNVWGRPNLSLACGICQKPYVAV